jgi:hypothetical protein
MTMSTAVIVAVSVFFLGMGVFALVSPAALVRPFRLAADANESRSEVRAVYGGFGIAIAAVLGVAASDPGGLRSGVVITVAAALAGMAAGRLVSRVIDGPTGFYPIWFYFWVESLAAALLSGTAT